MYRHNSFFYFILSTLLLCFLFALDSVSSAGLAFPTSAEVDTAIASSSSSSSSSNEILIKLNCTAAATNKRVFFAPATSVVEKLNTQHNGRHKRFLISGCPWNDLREIRVYNRLPRDSTLEISNNDLRFIYFRELDANPFVRGDDGVLLAPKKFDLASRNNRVFVHSNQFAHMYPVESDQIKMDGFSFENSVGSSVEIVNNTFELGDVWEQNPDGRRGPHETSVSFSNNAVDLPDFNLVISHNQLYSREIPVGTPLTWPLIDCKKNRIKAINFINMTHNKVTINNLLNNMFVFVKLIASRLSSVSGGVFLEHNAILHRPPRFQNASSVDSRLYCVGLYVFYNEDDWNVFVPINNAHGAVWQDIRIISLSHNRIDVDFDFFQNRDVRGGDLRAISMSFAVHFAGWIYTVWKMANWVAPCWMRRVDLIALNNNSVITPPYLAVSLVHAVHVDFNSMMMREIRRVEANDNRVVSFAFGEAITVYWSVDTIIAEIDLFVVANNSVRGDILLPPGATAHDWETHAPLEDIVACYLIFENSKFSQLSIVPNISWADAGGTGAQNAPRSLNVLIAGNTATGTANEPKICAFELSYLYNTVGYVNVSNNYANITAIFLPPYLSVPEQPNKDHNRNEEPITRQSAEFIGMNVLYWRLRPLMEFGEVVARNNTFFARYGNASNQSAMLNNIAGLLVSARTPQVARFDGGFLFVDNYCHFAELGQSVDMLHFTSCVLFSSAVDPTQRTNESVLPDKWDATPMGSIRVVNNTMIIADVRYCTPTSCAAILLSQASNFLVMQTVYIIGNRITYSNFSRKNGHVAASPIMFTNVNVDRKRVETLSFFPAMVRYIQDASYAWVIGARPASSSSSSSPSSSPATGIDNNNQEHVEQPKRMTAIVIQRNTFVMENVSGQSVSFINFATGANTTLDGDLIIDNNSFVLAEQQRGAGSGGGGGGGILVGAGGTSILAVLSLVVKGVYTSLDNTQTALLADAIMSPMTIHGSLVFSNNSVAAAVDSLFSFAYGIVADSIVLSGNNNNADKNSDGGDRGHQEQEERGNTGPGLLRLESTTPTSPIRLFRCTPPVLLQQLVPPLGAPELNVSSVVIDGISLVMTSEKAAVQLVDASGCRFRRRAADSPISSAFEAVKSATSRSSSSFFSFSIVNSHIILASGAAQPVVFDARAVDFSEDAVGEFFATRAASSTAAAPARLLSLQVENTAIWCVPRSDFGTSNESRDITALRRDVWPSAAPLSSPIANLPSRGTDINVSRSNISMAALRRAALMSFAPPTRGGGLLSANVSVTSTRLFVPEAAASTMSGGAALVLHRAGAFGSPAEMIAASERVYLLSRCLFVNGELASPFDHLGAPNNSVSAVRRRCLGFDTDSRSLSVSKSVVPLCAPFLLEDTPSSTDQKKSAQRHQIIIPAAPAGSQRSQQEETAVIYSFRTTREFIYRRRASMLVALVLDAERDTPAPVVDGKRIVPPLLAPLEGAQQQQHFTKFREHVPLGSDAVSALTPDVAVVGSAAAVGPQALRLDVRIAPRGSGAEPLDKAKDYVAVFAVSAIALACNAPSVNGGANLHSGSANGAFPSWFREVRMYLRGRRSIFSSSARESLGAASSVAIVMTVPVSGPMVARNAARSTLLSQYEDCMWEPSDPPEFELSPLGLSIGEDDARYLRGAVIGNGLVLFIFAAAIAAMAALWLVYRGWKRDRDWYELQRILREREDKEREEQEAELQARLEQRVQDETDGEARLRHQRTLEKFRRRIRPRRGALPAPPVERRSWWRQFARAIVSLALIDVILAVNAIVMQGSVSASVALWIYGPKEKGTQAVDRAMAAGTLLVTLIVGLYMWRASTTLLARHPHVTYVLEEDKKKLREMIEDSDSPEDDEVVRYVLHVPSKACAQCAAQRARVRRKERRKMLRRVASLRSIRELSNDEGGGGLLSQEQQQQLDEEMLELEIRDPERRISGAKHIFLSMQHFFRYNGEWTVLRRPSREYRALRGEHVSLSEPFLEPEQQPQQQRDGASHADDAGPGRAALRRDAAVADRESSSVTVSTATDSAAGSSSSGGGAERGGARRAERDPAVALNAKKRRAGRRFLTRNQEVFSDCHGGAAWYCAFEYLLLFLCAALSGVHPEPESQGCATFGVILAILNVIPLAVLLSYYPFRHRVMNTYSIIAGITVAIQSILICARFLETESFGLAEIEFVMESIEAVFDIFDCAMMAYDVTSLFWETPKVLVYFGRRLRHTLFHVEWCGFFTKRRGSGFDSGDDEELTAHREADFRYVMGRDGEDDDEEEELEFASDVDRSASVLSSATSSAPTSRLRSRSAAPMCWDLDRNDEGVIGRSRSHQ